MSFIDDLIVRGFLKTERIINAFREIKREDFLPRDTRYLAGLDEALPIGHEQTISQPLTVAFMLELLEPESGDKILDVGSGSGWTSALLAHIVGQNGKVVGVEIIPELKEFGERNVAKYNFIEKGVVRMVCGDGSKGFPEEAPFDKILASASAKKIPKAWGEQLKIEGKIVTPVKTSIWLFIKKSPKEFEKIEYPGFVFVPLIEE